MQKALIRIVAAGGAVLALVPGAVWAQAPDADRYAYGPRMMWWDGGWYGMVFGPVFMILVLAVVVAVAVLLVRGLGGSWQGSAPPHHQPPPGRTSLDILKERFARGEIDKNEYEERRRVLGE